MRTLKKFLPVTFLLLLSGLCCSPAAFAQLTLLSYSPAATQTPPGSHYYIIDEPIAYDGIALAWDFSKGLDAKFVQDISNITVKEKGSAVEQKFDNSTAITTPTDTGGLIITNADFTYTKEGSGSDPVQIRRIELKPTTVAFEAGKTYIVTVYNDLNGNTFQSNNGNILDATYAFEFETQPLLSSSSTTTSAALSTSTTTSVAGSSTTTSAASSTSTTTTATCIFVQALGKGHAQELAAFRSLRDTRLVWSARGFLYVLQYYFHAPELSRILHEHEDLLLRFRLLALEIAPQTELALRSGQDIQISRLQYLEILSLMQDTAIHASPLLQKTIAEICGNLTAGVLPATFGIVMIED